MREFLSKNTLLSTLLMAGAASDRIILVVEGEDDLHVLKRHVAGDIMLIPGVGGRRGLLEAAESADRMRWCRVRFLIDSDLDQIVSEAEARPELVVATQSHDLFMDLVNGSSHLLRYVIETHSRATVRRGVDVSAEGALADAKSLAKKLTALRVANERGGWGLTFAKFPFGALSSRLASLEDMAEVVIKRSQVPMQASELVSVADDVLSDSSIDLELLVGDHDFFGALAMSLRCHSVKGVSQDQLLSSFMAGIQCRAVQRTEWFKDLVKWAAGLGKAAFECPSCMTV